MNDILDLEIFFSYVSHRPNNGPKIFLSTTFKSIEVIIASFLITNCKARKYFRIQIISEVLFSQIVAISGLQL